MASFDQAMAEAQEMMNAHFAFLSMSKQRNNLLMWSHYTDAHQGFVLGMDSQSPFFDSGKGKGVDGLREVVYSKKRHAMPKGGLASLPAYKIQEANVENFFTKSPEWSYEEELRILGDPKMADVKRPDPAGGKYEILLYKFPPESVREIVLGYRMGNATRARIVDVMRGKYPHAQVCEAVLSETDFAVGIVPLQH